MVSPCLQTAVEGNSLCIRLLLTELPDYFCGHLARSSSLRSLAADREHMKFSFDMFKHVVAKENHMLQWDSLPHQPDSLGHLC